MSKIIWLEGLSGSGKTTIANYVKEVCGGLIVFDGDNIRNILTGLGFTKEDRLEQARRVRELCKTITDQVNINILVSLITPYEESREDNRKYLSNYYEVYLSTPLDECETRDVKGLYKKAREGEIECFTGISDPFEIPQSPNLVIDTSKENLGKSAWRVIDLIRN